MMLTWLAFIFFKRLFYDVTLNILILYSDLLNTDAWNPAHFFLWVSLLKIKWILTIFLLGQEHSMAFYLCLHCMLTLFELEFLFYLSFLANEEASYVHIGRYSISTEKSGNNNHILACYVLKHVLWRSN